MKSFRICHKRCPGSNAANADTYVLHLSVIHIHIRIQAMKKIFTPTIDFSKVDTLIYHLPDGPTLSVNMHSFEEIFDLEMEIGEVCDTSDIDGVVHFFPKGNA